MAGSIKRLPLILLAIIAGAVLGVFSIFVYAVWQSHTSQLQTEAAILKPVKVFQIGFSKCGTSTIAEFFNLNGVPAIHHDFGHLATSIFSNAAQQQPLISQQYANYLVFTDMERMYDDPPLNVGLSLFKELDKQYPGSKFILNTRSKSAWLKSRAAHPIGHTNTLVLKNAQILNISTSEVIIRWSNEWDAHHAAVLEYFKDRPDDLLVFNIDSDPPAKLVEFFKPYFKLRADLYQHKNKSSERAKLKDEPVEQVEFLSAVYALQ